MKICHVTSAHPRYDIRIFKKMCLSLAKNNFDCCLVVADGKGDEVVNDVHIFDVGYIDSGRLNRMTKTVYKVYKSSKSINADIYHLHDPELMFIGLLLRLKGFKVVFDCHEDLPKQIRSKPYMGNFLRFILPPIFLLLERLIFPFYNGLIAATPIIKDKLFKINKNSIDINNYPILGELSLSRDVKVYNNVCYVGGITEIRGIFEMLSCLEYLDDTNLILAGSFDSVRLKNNVEKHSYWNDVVHLGEISREKVAELLSSSLAGLVLFHDVPNHLEAQPNKMFEYMSAGLPVISSNFELWKNIIEDNNCGICVDYKNPKEIATAISLLKSNPEHATMLGKNGFDAVKNKYNWAVEERKLIDFYYLLGG